MAENSKNVLHGSKLTGLWPKKTFLSQSSKKLQIWHGTTHLALVGIEIRGPYGAKTLYQKLHLKI